METSVQEDQPNEPPRRVPYWNCRLVSADDNPGSGSRVSGKVPSSAYSRRLEAVCRRGLVIGAASYCGAPYNQWQQGFGGVKTEPRSNA